MYMCEGNTKINLVFGKYKINYAYLLDHLKKCNHDIFIDISVTLYRVLTLDDTLEKMDIVKNVLDLVAHYRHFFKSRLGFYCNIYLYWSTNVPRELLKYSSHYEFKFSKAWNSHEYKKQREFIEKELKFLNVFSKYLINTYLIDTKDVDRYVVPKIVSGDNHPLFIIDGDTKYLDYLNLYKGCDIIDISIRSKYHVVDNNITDYINHKFRLKIDDVPVKYISNIYTLAGNEKISLSGKKGYGFSKSVKKINSLLKKYSDISEYDLHYILGEQVEELDDILLYSLNKKNVRESDIKFIESQVEDRYSTKELNYINENYFSNKLFIDYLFEASDILSNRKKFNGGRKLQLNL